VIDQFRRTRADPPICAVARSSTIIDCGAPIGSICAVMSSGSADERMRAHHGIAPAPADFLLGNHAITWSVRIVVNRPGRCGAFHNLQNTVYTMESKTSV
jgi:hypothetical protein